MIRNKNQLKHNLLRNKGLIKIKKAIPNNIAEFYSVNFFFLTQILYFLVPLVDRPIRKMRTAVARIPINPPIISNIAISPTKA